MDPAIAPEWIEARRAEASKRRRAGYDPYERQARRLAVRERLLFAGATVTMGVLLSTFYAVLIR